jgi:hypothetical protein
MSARWLILLVVLIVGRDAWSADAKGKSAFVGEQHIYKKVDDRELRAFVVKPDGWKASDQRSALVLFHGGGWTGGTPTQFNDQAKYLATRGMVCVQIEYRLLKGKEGPRNPVCEMRNLPCVGFDRMPLNWVSIPNASALAAVPQAVTLQRS